jgi:hypothetical protein
VVWAVSVLGCYTCYNILSGSKHIAAVVRLNNRAGRQSVIGETHAISSSLGPFKFATFAINPFVEFVSRDIPLFKIDNHENRNFLLKDTETNPPDELS